MSPNPTTHPILALHYGALDPPGKANGGLPAAVQSQASKQTTYAGYQPLPCRAITEGIIRVQ